MTDEGKKRRSAGATAESDDDDRVAPTEDVAEVAQRKAHWEAKAAVKRERLGQLEQQDVADLVKSAMQTVGAEGVLKLLVAKKAKRVEEAKAIAAAAAKAAAEAASGVDLGYLRNIARRLTVMGEFDETRDDWGYQTTDAAGVERYLRLFASAQSFELQVLWMLLALECMQRARVSFHQFDEFKGAMRELHERERL
ncbi:hypothetical protein DYB36_013779 [Aphanomyces astaci]|uniref:Uncharacterized protein n=1 Tax=Aphanomyces astaci TaxID=112090 RepID=A0A397BQB7_APHAT|nr:hypothetical protein DYB36_013779 [Aphanomyces astaci]